ncbi:hypothetical protein ASE68_05435 [Agromyces sp. Leaf222]|nr:hypothetical protein ASE68_05435 [Agromyces sp. Leaf222]
MTAIPSFAYELRLLQQLRPEYAERIPYIIGLICGHQKTANYALQLAWRAGIHPEDLEEIDFRKKIPGRPSNKYATELRGNVNGQVVTAEATELFGMDWGLGMFKANFSDFTEDAFNETADIVLGDAWLPQYTADSRGTNVVITRSAELHDLVTSASQRGRLKLEIISPKLMMQSQTGLMRQNFQEVSARYNYLAKRGEYVPAIRRPSRKRVSMLRRRIQIERLRTSRVSHDAWLLAVRADDLAAFDRRMEAPIERYRRAQRTERRLRKPREALGRLWRKLQSRSALIAASIRGARS